MQVQGYSFNDGLFMLSLDVILLALLGYYLDQVLPKEYGVAKPWHFLCTAAKKRFSSSRNQVSRAQRQLGSEV